MKNKTPTTLYSALLAALCATLPAQATEGGALRGLNGAAGAEISSPQFPGLYGQVWVQHYRATKFRDVQGRSPAQTPEDSLVGPLNIERSGKLEATVGLLRGTWLSEMRWGEGKFGVSLSLPFAQLDQQLRLSTRFDASLPQAVRDLVTERLDLIAERASGKRHGLGDVELMPYFDWQTDSSRHALGLGLVAPTGDYEARRAVNVGAGNFWTLRPLLVASYVWENGFELGLRATYSINSKNRDTGNRSGQYLAADYSGHYRLNDSWKLGLQGFVNWQTTRDRCQDPDSELCGKVRAFGLGPVLSFTSEDGRWFVDAKLLREFAVRNRPEGTILWLRANIRLDE